MGNKTVAIIGGAFLLYLLTRGKLHEYVGFLKQQTGGQ